MPASRGGGGGRSVPSRPARRKERKPAPRPVRGPGPSMRVTGPSPRRPPSHPVLRPGHVRQEQQPKSPPQRLEARNRRGKPVLGMGHARQRPTPARPRGRGGLPTAAAMPISAAVRGVDSLGRLTPRTDLRAPVLSVLDQLSRPVHSVAAAALEDVRDVKAGRLPVGHGSLRAAKRGFQLKDRTLFSDVLKEAGVKNKLVRGVAGFGLDVALDPTTYLTLGASAVGKGGARGLQVGLGSAKTSGKTTAAIDRRLGLPKLAERARTSAPGRMTRHVNPNYRPPGASHAAHERIRAAGRTARAVATTGERQARNRSQALQRALGGEKHPKVIDAMERRDLSKLSAQERLAAETAEQEFKRMADVEKSAKLLGSEFREFGYVPRRPLSELEPKSSGTTAFGKGGGFRRGSARMVSSQARTNRQMRSEFRGTADDVYSESLPLSYYLRARDSAVKLGKAHVLQELRKTGQRWDPRKAIKEHEGVFEWSPRDGVRPVQGKELQALYAKGLDAVKGRDLYVFNEGLVKTAIDVLPNRVEELADLGRVWDRALQGRIKTILTVPNPQYHFTNMYGDLWKAYTATPQARKLAKSLALSAAAMGQMARREAAAKTLGKQLDSFGIKVTVNGKKVDLADELKLAENHGGTSTGFLGRDLPDVLEAQGKEAAEKLGQGRIAKRVPGGSKVTGSRVGSKAAHPIDAIRGASEYRENWVRFAVWLEARKRGMSPTQAAKHATQMVDYGDLTTFERSVMRRVFPFYTFTARNVPQQLHALATRPGKFANLEKARQEGAKAAGLQPGYEDQLEDYEKRGLPIPIPGVTVGGNPSLLFPKLPAADLAKLDPRTATETALSMLTPLVKVPVELQTNYNFFFKDKIDKYLDEKGPGGERVQELKPIPGWLEKAIATVPGAKEALHIERIHRKGKATWAWPAKLDYLAKQTPLSGTAIQFGQEIPNQRGQGSREKAISYATGLKVAPLDAKERQQRKTFDRRAYLQSLAEQTRQDGKAYAGGAKTGSKDDRLAPYQKVLDEIGTVERRLGLRKPKGKTPFWDKAAPKAGAGSSYWGKSSGGSSSSDSSYWATP